MREARIQALEVAAYRIPTDAPEADGTLEWQSTEMVVVHLRAGGETGTGYSYTAGVAASEIIEHKLRPYLENAPAMDVPAVWRRLNRALRNVGRPGLGLMAISAVDAALWDLKARLLNVSWAELWGSEREAVPVYGSGGFTSYSDQQMRDQLEGWREQGITAVKIKLGRDLKEDRRRVALARSVVGPEIELMVDANGAYERREALALTEALAEYEVSWLEEPVSSDDLAGLRWLRDQAPAGVAIAAGEYGWDSRYFKQMLQAEAVDILQADATRCGCSGFLQAAQLCEAFQCPISAHCAPALHAALCAAAPRFKHLEYFHDHVRIEQLFFDGVPALRQGMLWPDRQAPGHGLRLRVGDAEAYRL